MKDDCQFVQIDENMDGIIDECERSIMDDCLQNSLGSVELVRQNLIGHWKLVGHGEGWLPTISMPCSSLTFSDEQVIFKYQNQYIDTVTVHSWEVLEIQNPSGPSQIGLIITPRTITRMHLTSFCWSYMYGDATPSDGNMYLYKKKR